MIFHDHKAIFFHIGKTAGTSIEQMIAPGKRDPYVADRRTMFGHDPQLNVYLHHASCKTTLELVGQELFDTYFKFAIVRNPFSRLVSAYFYTYDQNKELYGTLKDYVRRLPELANHVEKLRGSHHIAQVHYTHIDGLQVCDFIGRFENLPAAVSEISARLGIEAALPRVNTARHPDYPAKESGDLFDDEMIAIMRDVYREDFSVFGYDDSPAR